MYAKFKEQQMDIWIKYTWLYMEYTLHNLNGWVLEEDMSCLQHCTRNSSASTYCLLDIRPEKVYWLLLSADLTEIGKFLQLVSLKH